MGPSASPLVLAYAVDTPQLPRSRLDLPFLLLGLPALAAVVAPFTFNVSPAHAIVESRGAFDWTRWDPGMTILLVAVPFLPPVLAWALRLRSVLRGSATRAERGIGYGVAFAAAAAVGVVLVAAAAELPTLQWSERAYFGAALLILTAGVALLALLSRRHAHADLRVRVALLAPYLANCAIVLAAFFDDRQLGWYLTAVSAAAALAELVLLTLKNSARPVR